MWAPLTAALGALGHLPALAGVATAAAVMAVGTTDAPRTPAREAPAPLSEPLSAWPEFRRAYVAEDGRVVDVEAGSISHTEGQGFGMLFAEAAGDRDSFDRIWRWTDSQLARPDVRLFSWKYDPARASPIADANNATDGDLLIAWALLRAARRWNAPDYARPSAEIRTAVATRLVARIGDRSLLLPGLEGFAGQGWYTYNPSYFVLPAVLDFAAAEPRGPWADLARDGLFWADRLRFGRDQLPPDWVRIDTKGVATLDPDHPPRFGFDAIRAPLYLVWGGQSRRRPVAAAGRFWRNFKGAPPAWVDLATGAVAPYPLSPGALRAAQVVEPRLRAAVPDQQTYYSAALLGLAELAQKERR